MTTPYNQTFFNEIATSFDSHVSQSIPLFSELQDNIASNVKLGDTVLDICGSTGKLGRLMASKGWHGGYTCLDGSKEMQDVFNSYPKHDSLRFELAGFMASWEDIEEFKPAHYDIAVECLGFQFYTKSRRAELNELKRIASLSVIFEKFNTDTDTFQANEDLKEPYKALSFTEQEREHKKETVLAAMSEYCYDAEQFDSLIKDTFKYVRKIAKIGNFAGYIATDNKLMFDSWIVNNSLINNQYNV